MCKPTKFNVMSVCMSALLLASALLFAAPVHAHAEQTAKELDSTMTVTMQKSSDNGSAGTSATASDDTAGSSDEGAQAVPSGKAASSEKIIPSEEATSSGKAISSGKTPSTGDAAPLAALGALVLCAGAAYCLRASWKLSFAQGAHSAQRSCGTRAGHASSNSAVKRMVAVVVSTALVAGLCFGAFATGAGAAQEESDLDGESADISDLGVDLADLDAECTADVVIDEEGNVLSADVSLVNNSDYTIDLLDIVAPEELGAEDWEALFEYGLWDEDGWHEYDLDAWAEKEVYSDELVVASSDAVAVASVDESAASASDVAAVASAGVGTATASSAVAVASSGESVATASDAMAVVKPGATATGKWSGTKVSSDVLAKVKASGSARLNYRAMVYPDLQDLFSWVTFDANAPSGTTATIGGKKDVVVKRMSNNGKLTSDIIPADSAVTCSDGDYVFMGWAQSKTDDAFSGKKNSDLAAANVTVWGTQTYYALWAKTGDYWLNIADAANPKDGMLKNQTLIDEDMQVLHGTKTQTSSGKDKAAVTAEYTNYMNGKNASGTAEHEVRLYSKWSGSDAGTGANRWVEFRVIQVGEHDGDGSAVTFIATHSLPSVKRMNNTNTSRGGWGASAMRNDTFANYVSGGLEGLASAALTVKKTALDGDTNDKLWLISSTEVFGSGDNNYVAHNFPWEGNQYTWFANNGVSMKWGWETKNGVLGNKQANLIPMRGASISQHLLHALY